MKSGTNSRKQVPSSDQPARVYFGDDRSTDWEDDARDLIASLVNFDHDEPEPLVKIFVLLEEMTTCANTRDALFLLAKACFVNSSAHGEPFAKYRAACLNAADAAPEQDREYREYRERKRRRDALPDDWIERFGNALAEAFESGALPDDFHNELYDLVLSTTDKNVSQVEFTRLLLPVALRQATQGNAKAPGDFRASLQELAREYGDGFGFVAESLLLNVPDKNLSTAELIELLVEEPTDARFRARALEMIRFQIELSKRCNRCDERPSPLARHAAEEGGGDAS